ncbi:hypothetical protein ACS126_15770 [Sphingobacterium lactis]|uniref:hypothetical protein n=1 Tax=Sphingobacterium lactis TaxID=797291 RepID=UPI003EC7382F
MRVINMLKQTQAEISSSYEVGQEWCYHTRGGEEQSLVTIVKIEDDEKYGPIIHIAVSGVLIKNLKYPNGVLEEIFHLPLVEGALRNSTTKLNRSNVHLPDYEFGYVRWKTAFDREEAGCFAIPLREIVQWLEDGTYEVKDVNEN